MLTKQLGKIRGWESLTRELFRIFNCVQDLVIGYMMMQVFENEA